MLKIWLIRHGETFGNSLGRYIGITDEPLTEKGVRFLETCAYPVPEQVFVSPRIRCRQTAGILYPGVPCTVVEEFAEFDFGDFENKNYQELNGNPAYQAWVDGGCRMAVPNGESMEIFQKRCLEGFDRAVDLCIKEKKTSAAMVVHGGTIMSIMERYGQPKREYYEWHVKNGCGYAVTLEAAGGMFTSVLQLGGEMQ